MALVRPLHCKCIALLAFTQRSLAGLDAPQLAQQSCNRQRGEHGDDERAHADANRLVAPRSHRDGLVARDRKLQGGVPYARDGDEVPLAVDLAQHSGGWRERRSRELGKLSPNGVRCPRITYQQRSVLAQEVDRTAAAEVDGSVELLELLEVDDGSDDTRESSLIVLNPA